MYVFVDCKTSRRTIIIATTCVQGINRMWLKYFDNQMVRIGYRAQFKPDEGLCVRFELGQAQRSN
jgi:hypothetical protein